MTLFLDEYDQSKIFVVCVLCFVLLILISIDFYGQIEYTVPNFSIFDHLNCLDVSSGIFAFCECLGNLVEFSKHPEFFDMTFDDIYWKYFHMLQLDSTDLEFLFLFWQLMIFRVLMNKLFNFTFCPFSTHNFFLTKGKCCFFEDFLRTLLLVCFFYFFPHTCIPRIFIFFSFSPTFFFSFSFNQNNKNKLSFRTFFLHSFTKRKLTGPLTYIFFFFS